MSHSRAGAAGETARSVLHITTVPASLRFLSGQPGYFRAHGWTVHVLSGPGAALDDFGEREAVITHVAAMTRSIAPLRDLRAVIQIIRVIRSVRPAIVHGHTPKAGLLAMIAAACARTPLRIYQVRGLPFETARGPLRLLLRTCERVSCGLAHRVLCDSHSLQQTLLRERLCRPDKVSTLCNGTSLDAQGRWNPARIAAAELCRLRADLHIDESAPVIGYVGRLAREKGIAELAQAWRLVRAHAPAARLLVLGALDARDPIPASVLSELHADASVRVIGRVDDPLPYYRLMDVLVLPSYREGMGLASLEAAALEVPVVAARVTGCVDAVQDGVTGTLIEPRSAPAIADALIAYLDDPELRRGHGAAGRERVLREFDPQSLWDATRSEYESLLGARVPQPALRAAGFGRRCFDVAAAAILLLITSPLLAIIAIAVWIDLRSPVLFRQKRTGLHGEPFTLHKFRTMREAHAPGRVLLPAARLTRLGRLLRNTSLDELPELWDVLRGRMSLVGPRPLLPEYLPYYNAEQARRHEVRPGITGWAQVHGRNRLSWDERLGLDAWYVDHASPLLDLQILVRTVPEVLGRRGVTPHGRLFMERFDDRRA